MSFAAIYAGLGDKEKTLDYLEQAVDRSRYVAPGAVCSEPSSIPLRTEPRFVALRQKIGLA